MKQTVQPILPSEGGDVGRPCAGGFAMTESVCKQSFVVAQLTLHLQKSTERLVSLAGDGIAWASHDGFVAAPDPSPQIIPKSSQKIACSLGTSAYAVMSKTRRSSRSAGIAEYQ